MTAPAPLDGVLLSIESEQALELGAARREGEPLSTTGLLLGILAADTVGAWSGVQLQSTYLESEDAHRFTDSEPEAVGVWHGVPLTADATTALTVAAAVAADYRLVPVPPGVLALGLLADPESGASRALLFEAELSHEALLELVQDDVLDGSFEDLDLEEVLAKSRHRSRRPQRDGPSRAVLRDPGWVTPEETALSVLASAVEQARDDEQLRELLASMLLDSESLTDVNRELAELPDEPAAEVYERIRRRYGSDGPTVLEVIVGCALSESARITEALRRLGLSPAELAGQVAELREQRVGNDSPPFSVFAATVINGLATLATTVLVVAAAADGAWWKLLFIWLVWTGHPQSGPAGSAVTSLILFFVVSPIAGIVSFAGIPADLLQGAAERQALLARTGVYVNLRELRNIVCRLLRPRALRAQRQRQLMRARLRALSDGRDWQ